MADDLPSPPIARSFALTPALFGGVYPGDRDPDTARKKIGALVDFGITLLLDLTEDGEPAGGGKPLVSYAPALAEVVAARGSNARRMGIPIRDNDIASDEVIHEAIRTIDEELAAGGKVYVHCWGGKGRTGLVLGCYLARTHGADARGHLNEIRTPQMSHSNDLVMVPETPAQRAVVDRWVAGDAGAR